MCYHYTTEPRISNRLSESHPHTYDSGSGVLITFSGFLMNTLIGFIFYAHFGKKKNAIPLRPWSAEGTTIATPLGKETY
ncbi:unnamed protein product, partial [Darwinula stevensoni]